VSRRRPKRRRCRAPLVAVLAALLLAAAGADPARHPQRVDAVAAQILLQEALDRRTGA
jgi:RNase H-fold protein (predicted Holliday junction resolvase)